jgi:glycosyltransferase involved in cell wall biosynthesis
MKLSIVVPTFNSWYLLHDIVKNIMECVSVEHEIIIIDDGSTDDTKEILESIQWENIIKLIYGSNKWITKWWNDGVDIARGEYIRVINNDIIFEKWVVERLIDELQWDIMMTFPMYTLWDKPFEWKIRWYHHDNICWFAFMFRKSDKDKLFPIDERLKIRAWDWYLFNMILKENKKEMKWIEDIVIHHLQSQTVWVLPDYSNLRKEWCEARAVVCHERHR